MEAARFDRGFALWQGAPPNAAWLRPALAPNTQMET